MANLSVRNLDKKAYQQLRIRAAEHGVSMEEEVRQIIYQAVSRPQKLGDSFQKHFGSENGVDLDDHIHPRNPHKPMDFK